MSAEPWVGAAEEHATAEVPLSRALTATSAVDDAAAARQAILGLMTGLQAAEVAAAASCDCVDLMHVRGRAVGQVQLQLRYNQPVRGPATASAAAAAGTAAPRGGCNLQAQLAVQLAAGKEQQQQLEQCTQQLGKAHEELQRHAAELAQTAAAHRQLQQEHMSAQEVAEQLQRELQQRQAELAAKQLQLEQLEQQHLEQQQLLQQQQSHPNRIRITRSDTYSLQQDPSFPTTAAAAPSQQQQQQMDTAHVDASH